MEHLNHLPKRGNSLGLPRLRLASHRSLPDLPTLVTVESDLLEAQLSVQLLSQEQILALNWSPTNSHNGYATLHPPGVYSGGDAAHLQRHSGILYYFLLKKHYDFASV